MNTKTIIAIAGLMLAASAGLHAQEKEGMYTNPIIYADYSDPDVIRVGEDYWMVASSFTSMPGIPVLHSKDLIHWEIVNHVYDTLPYDKYKFPAHGEGSWAPSIRYHDGLYYVYFCTPYDGLFVARATDPRGEWDLHEVAHVNKWEDPCPLWDDDGQAYLVHSIHRGGPAILHKMSPDGLRLLDDGVTVYHDPELNPILEGLKMEKRNGYYYIHAPAGGVETGWQEVLRAKNIYGPYEPKRILEEGNGVNGPHQGALVETQNGEHWFIHFQSKGAWGRIINMQPAGWVDDWPVMGVDIDNDGVGEPVLSYRLPNLPAGNTEIQTSDDFSGKSLGRQWQWQATQQDSWFSLTANPGKMRLFVQPCPSEGGNLYYAGNILLQKFCAPNFTATVSVEASLASDGDRAGLIIMGNPYTHISLIRQDGKNKIAVVTGWNDRLGQGWPRELATAELGGNVSKVWFKVDVTEDSFCSFSYSLDGREFKTLGERFMAFPGTWIGSKVGIFASTPSLLESEGFADFDDFIISD